MGNSYIDKNAVIQVLEQIICTNNNSGIEMCIKLVNELPDENVTKTIIAKNIAPCENGRVFFCSHCGFGFDDYYSNDENMMPDNRLKYCPNCGAKIYIE